MTKTIKISILFLFIATFTFAQDISYKDIGFKYKKGFVTLNKQNIFKLKYSAGYYYIYDLNSGEELMYFYINDNETSAYFDDDYVKVYFTSSKKSLETKTHQMIIMERLINEKVITPQWNLDNSKIDDFIAKYDESITQRTNR